MEHLFNIVLVILALQMPTTIHTLIVRDKSTNPPKIILSLKEISTENSDFDYRLYTSTNSIETLINHNNTFDLILDPQLSGNDTKQLLTRFSCEDEETKDYNWNSTENNCNILELSEYDYIFKDGENSTKIITIKTLKQGKTQLVAHAKWISNTSNLTVDAWKAYVTVNIGVSDTILVISAIIGWIYFIAWSISFYPQIWDNYKRKSVVGLNFDFVGLNITGFISYTMFNFSLYAIDSVQKEYEKVNPRSQIPVQLNDVFFGFHAAFATLICIIQCFLYDRGEQTVSWFARIFLGIVWIGYLVLAIIVASTSWLNMLDYLYIFSYVKLVITIIKYIPQAWYNYRRKSTIGWSIGNIFLDFTGGSLSMCQMFLLAYNYDDWATIFHNFTKFGLGFISILFDVFFLLQHYVFYRHSDVQDSRSLLA
ncbi:lysosomal cystine transporter cystinosin [Dermatophagoides pteronyssinus]|uniref:lysosomal cystine transporter cystinosin n=1 Tax=Dermatophagoides pteronyssinus TaxID=6956 RepID=UPI003F67F68A